MRASALTFFTLGAAIAVRLRLGYSVPFSGPAGTARGARLGRWLVPVFLLAAVLYTALLREVQRLCETRRSRARSRSFAISSSFTIFTAASTRSRTIDSTSRPT